MDTYAHGYGTTGHYARPGTHTSYCGRELQHTPNNGIAQRVCKACAKAEAADRTAAEQTAADHNPHAPTLATRAGVRYAIVGTGRRVHYSGNDDTLCGREVTEYTHGPDERHPDLCAACIKAAEQRAYARSLAAASPLAAAAVDLAETVEETAAQQRPATTRNEPSDWWTITHPVTDEEIARVPGETAAEMTERAEALPEVRAIIRKHRGFSRRRLYTSELKPAQHLDTAEADATDSTWRGEWISEQPTGDTLFALAPAAEQGALFTNRTAEQAVNDQHQAWAVDHRAMLGGEWQGLTVCGLTRYAAHDRASALRATGSRDVTARPCDHGPGAHGDDVAKQQATEDAYFAAARARRAELDARRADRRSATTDAEQQPERRIIEGVIVDHNGTAEGSTPADSTHPNVRAARAALDGLKVARLTDHHDVTEPTEAETDVRGYMIDPREGDRIAVYWLEEGRIVRRDQMPHGPALDCLADRLRRCGWSVEKMLRTSQCVFAHRPQ